MVRHIEFQGKKYPFRVSYKALKLTRSELGRDFKSEEKAFDYEGAESLLYHALKTGAKETEEELDLKRSQMVDVLDEHKNFHVFIDAYAAFFLAPQEGGGS